MRARMVAALALALAALSCNAPTGDHRSGPGTVSIRFDSPNTGDGALKLSLSGPGITAVTASGDLMVFSRQGGGTTTTIAIFGELADGLIVTFDVPDLADLESYRATLLEVAGPDNNLRASLAGYSVSVEY
jgi:hypothetical protein